MDITTGIFVLTPADGLYLVLVQMSGDRNCIDLALLSMFHTKTEIEYCLWNVFKWKLTGVLNENRQTRDSSKKHDYIYFQSLSSLLQGIIWGCGLWKMLQVQWKKKRMKAEHKCKMTSCLWTMTFLLRGNVILVMVASIHTHWWDGMDLETL